MQLVQAIYQTSGFNKLCIVSSDILLKIFVP